jgi:hypothetical protein
MHIQKRPLADRAARLEAQLAAIRTVQATLETLREILAEFPELRDDYADEIRLIAGDTDEVESDTQNRSELKPEGIVNGQHRTPPMEFLVGSNYDRICAFLKSRANTPAPVEEIHKATLLPESSIRHAFSTGYKGKFAWVKHEGNPLKHWRLRNPDDAVLPNGRWLDSTKQRVMDEANNESREE